MKLMIAYTDKSCVTGKLLRTLLRCPRKRTQKRANVNFFLRWGSSEAFPTTRVGLELNTAQAVANATNKFKMLTLLKEAGIPTPVFTNNPETANTLRDADGKFYVRSRGGEVRYDGAFNPATDSYVSQPIANKRREYRVHVFNGKIIAIYEKIPNQTEGNTERPKLYKSYNCHFSLVDPEVSRCDANGQQIAIKSVAALGLLFGGVDLMRDKHGNFTVCEVNSAPGLNDTNAGRWVAAIQEYINGANTTTNLTR